MNIWGWVWDRSSDLYDQDLDSLVDLIDAIPGLALDHEPDKVDQVCEQALPMVQALDDKWLEIFFRHWRLQSHVLHQYDAKGMLPEAVSLLDFAHQKETQDCPQRICAVQDLAACYGIIDGPGFVDERVAVCQETLGQIDGSWPCFQCVGGELLQALVDGERTQEALTEYEAIEAELTKHGETIDMELALVIGRAFITAGDLESAWSVIEKAENVGYESSFERNKRFVKTLIHCLRGDWDAAAELCPSFEEAFEAAQYFDDWTRIKFLMVAEGLIPNNEELRFRFHRMADNLASKEANRAAFRVLERLTKLCLEAGARFRAAVALKSMGQVRQRLNKDLGATARLDNLQTQFKVLDAVDDLLQFKTAEALLSHEFESSDSAFSALSAGRAQWPDNADIIVRLSQIHADNFEPEKAFALLEFAHTHLPGDAVIEHYYGSAFIDRNGIAAYREAFPMDELDGLNDGAVWNRGFLYARHLADADVPAVLAALETVERYWPDNAELLGHIARTQATLGNYKAAMASRRQQIALEPDVSDHKWDLLIAATLAGESATIVEMADTLDMQVQPDGTYENDKQPAARIEMAIPDGSKEIFWATRVGPALAQITTVSHREAGYQYYGHQVVFDPLPMNQLDQQDEDGNACDKEGFYSYLYPSIRATHTPEHKLFTIDGAHPGEDALTRLADQVTDAGFVFNRRSDENYVLFFDDADGKEQKLPGVYIYILAPEAADLKVLDRLLQTFNDDLTHPLVWLDLLKVLGDTERLEEQAATAERYDLEH